MHAIAPLKARPAFNHIVVFTFASIAASCSGSSGTDSPAPTPATNAPPTVAAGTDQFADEADVIALSGQVSDPEDAPATNWSQIAGPTVQLSDPAALSPRFLAPTISEETQLTFRLTADDGVNPPVSDDVDVVISDVFADPYYVDPIETDPAISAGAPHFIAPARPAKFVAADAEPSDGKLFVFFPGTGARPDDYTNLIENAAANGYTAIGLSYRNEIAVRSLCTLGGPGAGDPDCQEKVRTEIITGEDSSELVDVSFSDSITHRLTELLDYLAVTDGSADWGGFLIDGAPNWSSIAVAGHSQGGGHAAFLGKLEQVDRSILFSSTENADWTRKPGITASQRYFGFAHSLEQPYTSIINSWASLALPGQLENIDDGAPTNGSQRLFTSRPLCSGSSTDSAYHQCTSSDAFTPRDDIGAPVFTDIWDLLLTSPGADAPSADAALGLGSKSYMDPEILMSEGLMTFIDEDDSSIWVARLDPLTGLFVSADGLESQVDDDVVPFSLQNLNGPEFGVDQDGWALFYAKRGFPGDDIQIWRAAGDGQGGFAVDQLTTGAPHHTALARQDPAFASVAIAAVSGDDPRNGPVVAFNETAPALETAVLASRDDGVNAAFFSDREALATSDLIDGFRQIVSVDLATGVKTQLTFEPDDKTDIQIIEDADGAEPPIIAAARDRAAIGVWREDADGGFSHIRDLLAPAQSGRTRLRSLEAFFLGGAPYLAVNVFDDDAGEIWVYPLDGAAPTRCDQLDDQSLVEPEPWVVNGRAFIYYSDVGGTPSWRLRRCVFEN